jgi:hypothetical protein
LLAIREILANATGTVFRERHGLGRGSAGVHDDRTDVLGRLAQRIVEQMRVTMRRRGLRVSEQRTDQRQTVPADTNALA